MPGEAQRNPMIERDGGRIVDRRVESGPGLQVVRSIRGVAVGDPRLHFGLGEVTGVDRVTVVWLDGSEITRAEPPLNGLIKIAR